jgi:hypothetical protein
MTSKSKGKPAMNKPTDDTVLTNVQLLHKPKWRLADDAWEMVVGNRAVAALVPVSPCAWLPQFQWMTRIFCEDLPNDGWDCVDCTLEGGQELLEQW